MQGTTSTTCDSPSSWLQDCVTSADCDCTLSCVKPCPTCQARCTTPCTTNADCIGVKQGTLALPNCFIVNAAYGGYCSTP